MCDIMTEWNVCGKGKLYMHRYGIAVRMDSNYKTPNRTAYMKDWLNKNRLRIKKINKQKTLEVKLSIITHYSDNKNCCSVCGFSDIRALQIDHINGGGSKHSKETNNQLYNWLIKNNYPEGFQVLCANCNWIKRDTNNELDKRESLRNP